MFVVVGGSLEATSAGRSGVSDHWAASRQARQRRPRRPAPTLHHRTMAAARHPDHAEYVRPIVHWGQAWDTWRPRSTRWARTSAGSGWPVHQRCRPTRSPASGTRSGRLTRRRSLLAKQKNLGPAPSLRRHPLRRAGVPVDVHIGLRCRPRM